MLQVICTQCGSPYPKTGAPYRCSACGGLYDYDAFLYPLPDKWKNEHTHLPGIWCYREAFGLAANAPLISLGEGHTPLVWSEGFGRRVALKCEYLNPSGSFKDRGAATLVSFLLSRGVSEAIEDSSGNAGAAFGAYAARAGVRARIFMPAYTSGAKRRQIDAYGSEAIALTGTRQDAADAARRAAESGAVYASHAYLPFVLPGYATAAYEIVEQLGYKAPGTVVVPAGQGNFLLALARGFESMLRSGWIEQMPRMIGVQAAACAPLAAYAAGGMAALGHVLDNETLAEGVRVFQPVRLETVIQTVNTSNGTVLAVDEAAILPARNQLARLGFYVEPTSALVWGALMQLAGNTPEPIVLVLTGSGLKTGG
ncbi:MAG: pyridoxal-phosphate dependent enzyme [Chloroflexota bacterium]